jgi:hypothetical protein
MKLGTVVFGYGYPYLHRVPAILAHPVDHENTLEIFHGLAS